MLSPVASFTGSGLPGASRQIRTRVASDLDGLLKGEGFATRVLNADESDDPSDPALRLATMHRVKGLEFDQVFQPGLDGSQLLAASD